MIFLTTIAFWFRNIFSRCITLITVERWLKILHGVVFIAQIGHCGNFTALRKLILFVLQLTNQIN